MIHSVKDLSPDQKLAHESLLGRSISEEEQVSVRAVPASPEWLASIQQDSRKKGTDTTLRWTTSTRRLPPHGVSVASVLDNDSGCHRHQRPRFSIIDYEDVLKRPRLAIDPGKAADAMTRIREVVSVVSSAASVAAAIDPDDNRFLECAQAAQAHYLVTGNTRHFPGAWKETRLVTPREFIDAWESAPDESR